MLTHPLKGEQSNCNSLISTYTYITEEEVIIYINALISHVMQSSQLPRKYPTIFKQGLIMTII